MARSTAPPAATSQRLAVRSPPRGRGSRRGAASWRSRTAWPAVSSHDQHRESAVSVTGRTSSADPVAGTVPGPATGSATVKVLPSPAALDSSRSPPRIAGHPAGERQAEAGAGHRGTGARRGPGRTPRRPAPGRPRRCRCRCRGRLNRATSPSPASAVSVTAAGSVNFRALVSRLRRTWRSSMRSVSEAARRPGAARRPACTPGRLTSGAVVPRSSSKSAREVDRRRRTVSSRPDSALARSSSSLTSRSRSSALAAMSSTCWRCSSVSGSAAGSSSSRARPEHGVDRGAQLVADVGQEPGLGLARLAQLARSCRPSRRRARPRPGWCLQLVGELVVERHHARGWSPPARR